MESYFKFKYIIGIILHVVPLALISVYLSLPEYFILVLVFFIGWYSNDLVDFYIKTFKKLTGNL